MKARLMKSVAALAVSAAIALPASVAVAQDAKDTLRIGMYSKAPSRGNVYSSGSGVPSMYWWEGIFDGLTRVNDKGQIVPHGAVSWELVNNNTWRFTLRDDVIFSNGVKNSAQNVVKVFDYLLSEEGKPASVARDARKLESYRAIDDRTVEFVTKVPDPLWPATIQRIYIGEMQAFADRGKDGFAADPVTSGPWKVVSWKDTEALFTAHDKSWRPGKIKNIRIVELPEQVARRQALEAGQVDLITNMGPDDIAVIEASGNIAVVNDSPNVMSLMVFSEDFTGKWKDGKTPFADKRVRQAANYAIDRQSIVDNLFGGITVPASQPANPNTFGWNPNVKPYPYDPAKARALLAEAGYPNGFKMKAEVITGAIANDAEIYTFVSQQLGQVGIEVELRPLQFSEWLNKLLQKKWEGEATGFSYLVDPEMDASTPFRWYSCDSTAVTICIPEHMDLLHASAQEMDRDKREKMLQELMVKANEDALSIAILHGRDIFGMSKRVQGFTNWNRILVYENMTLGG